MKTENTLENKKKFFVLYWEQRNFVVPEHIENRYKVSSMRIDSLRENEYLELIDIKNLTKEDLRKINSICFKGNDFSFYHTDSKKYIEELKSFGFMMNEEIDYLRSKGYIAPYQDLSIDDLIEYGWVKIKNP